MWKSPILSVRGKQKGQFWRRTPSESPKDPVRFDQRDENRQEFGRHPGQRLLRLELPFGNKFLLGAWYFLSGYQLKPLIWISGSSGTSTTWAWWWLFLTFSFLIFNVGQPISPLGHRKLSLGATLLYLNPVFLTRSTTGRNGNDQTLLKKKRKALFITQLTEILDWLFSIEFFAVPFLSLSSSAARRSRSLGLSVTTVSEWMVF